MWSLGCILYFLTNLTHPFHDEKNGFVNYRKMFKQEYDPINKKYSHLLRNIIKGMLEGDPAKRFTAS